MPIVDIYGERKKREIMQDTWGHLAPQTGQSYKGYMIWAYGGWGDIVLLDAAFENLNNSPWLFEAMQEYIGEFLDSEGVYRWEGQYEDCNCFNGEVKRLDFKDIFQSKP